MLRVHFINGESINIDCAISEFRESIKLLQKYSSHNVNILQHDGFAFVLNNVTYFEEFDPTEELNETDSALNRLSRAIKSADTVLYDSKGGALFKSEEEK